MSRRKQNKRKYTVVRTTIQESPKMDLGTKRAVAGVAGALAALLAREAIDVIPDYILLPLAGVCAWFAPVQAGWFPILGRRYIHYLGYLGAIILAFSLSALFASRKGPEVSRDTSQAVSTPRPVTATAQNSPGANVVAVGEANDVTVYQSDPNERAEIRRTLEDLQAMVSGLRENEMQHLEQEYPLGFVLVAFSGEVKRVLPYSDIVEGDWGRLIVRRDGKTLISVNIPYLRDLRSGGTLLVSCKFQIQAKPGARKAIPLKNIEGWVECVKTEPIGICIALGFRDKG